MANVDPKQQILLRVAAITASDLAIAGWIVWQSIEEGASFIFPTMRRDQQPVRFWLSIAAVIVVALGFAGALTYAVLD